MTQSILQNTWSLRESDESLSKRYMDVFGLTEIEARLVTMLNLEEGEVQDFLDPKMRNLMPDPFHLKDMEKGVTRAIQAIDKGEKICIFGDYDVDGATSSALIKKFMHNIGTEIDIYIPDRMKEGYGPTISAMKKLKERGINLIITVDCGSMSHGAIEFATKEGMDVVIIDHHICIEKLPTAQAIINPNRLDETSKYGHLAAVGVSFLFVVGLMQSLKKKGFFKEKEEPNLMDFLDIVALGTVCDVVPLKGLNRAFVRQGLKIMAQRKNIGLNALCDSARLDQMPSTYHLGYVLGPRINAGGRVGESYLGSALLSSNSKIEAEDLAAKLEEYNIERRSVEANIIDIALDMASKQKDDNSIFVYGNWHPGVIGIVAGKLKEIHQKPVIVGSLIDGVCKASCRSIPGIDFGTILGLAKQENLVSEGGGHAMAAGFTTSEDLIDDLKSFLNESFSKHKKDMEKGRQKHYELELTSDALSMDLYHKIENLGPFGAGNKEPMVRIDDLYVLRSHIVGEKHISVMLACSNGGYKGRAIFAISFNSVGTDLENILMAAKKSNISVIGQIKEYNRHGQSHPQLVISDVISLC